MALIYVKWCYADKHVLILSRYKNIHSLNFPTYCFLCRAYHDFETVYTVKWCILLTSKYNTDVDQNFSYI